MTELILTSSGMPPLRSRVEAATLRSEAYFRRLGLPTYPDHKHEGREDHGVASSASDLPDIPGKIVARKTT